ncbi:MAG: hypothetical protein MPL62_02060 [Alphaproteobacteria bacterium]|nr:hypothetical protein [Alphaproteobacteria bacterium]
MTRRPRNYNIRISAKVPPVPGSVRENAHGRGVGMRPRASERHTPDV